MNRITYWAIGAFILILFVVIWLKLIVSMADWPMPNLGWT